MQQALVMEREVSVVAMQTGCTFAGRRREQRRRLERHPCNQAACTAVVTMMRPRSAQSQVAIFDDASQIAEFSLMARVG